MIIKAKESDAAVVARLEELKARTDLDSERARQIARDLHALKQGGRGERECAFFLDPLIRDHPNRVILHDLRLEHLDEVAQIDHLLINRGMHFHVMESKSFAHGLRISERGEFEYWNGRTYCGMRSPLEQVRRQARILEGVLRASDLLPKRLGFTLAPTFHGHVLVAPSARIIRPKPHVFDSSSVVKSDAFMTEYERDAARDQSVAGALLALVKTVSKDTIIAIGQGLARLHRPAATDYERKYRLPPHAMVAVASTPSTGTAPNDEARCLPTPEIKPRQTGPHPPLAAEPPPAQSMEPPCCPRCGQAMVLRTARRGE